MYSQKAIPNSLLYPSSKCNIPKSPNRIPQTRIKPMKRIENFSYCPQEQIGLGYSSKVYKGRNDITNQLVAVKVINLKESQDELQKMMVKNEIKILEKIAKQAQLDHLLKLYGVMKTKNNLYIITELCEGKDLGKILRSKKYLNEVQAQSIMKQIIQGYLQIQNLSIIHRDLKPANIFIKGNKMVLADFGFAIQKQMCLDAQKSEFNVGSPYYMPPEALKDNKYSVKSDIWALGVIAYELVFGVQPWKNPVDKLLFQKMQKQPIKYILSMNKDSELISENYKNFIINCLQFDAEKRADVNFLKNFDWCKQNENILKFSCDLIHSQKQTLFNKKCLQSSNLINIQHRNDIDNKRKTSIVFSMQNMEGQNIPMANRQYKVETQNKFDDTLPTRNSHIFNQGESVNIDHKNNKNQQFNKLAKPPLMHSRPPSTHKISTCNQNILKQFKNQVYFFKFINLTIVMLNKGERILIESLQIYLNQILYNIKRIFSEINRSTIYKQQQLTYLQQLILDIEKCSKSINAYTNKLSVNQIIQHLKNKICHMKLSLERAQNQQQFEISVYLYQVLTLRCKYSGLQFVKKSKIEWLYSYFANKFTGMYIVSPQTLENMIQRCNYLHL